MAVNLTPPDSLLAVPGIRLATAAAGIRHRDRQDVLLISCAPGTRGAAIFTRNAFRAAPVVISEQRSDVSPQAILVNSGNANAGTGRPGTEAALSCSSAVSDRLAISDDSVWLASTGVIGECLPGERIVNVVPDLVAALTEDAWPPAAAAIMTTDSLAKGLSTTVEIEGRRVTVTGIAKGAGMIRPDMATMLAFVATDADIDAALLQQMLLRANAESFGCISVDGDTSTNDSCFLLATGQAGNTCIEAEGEAQAAVEAAITEVCIHLARCIVRDGEGATHVADIKVTQARDADEARRVAETVAHSPLVKTAMFAADPNWGRILAAVGRSGIEDLDTGSVDIWLDDVRLLKAGEPDPDYRDELGSQVMARPEYDIRIVLNRGNAAAHIWTCDFGHEYVRINAEYRT